jgi:cyclopropane fatty-acyl-phospholipid synthase-like methyltransferase
MSGRTPISAASIRARYQALYGKGQLSLSKNYSDKFPLLEHLLADEVRGRDVLDFGCGPGRLSLMLARHARTVHGVDYAGEGIELAGTLAQAASAANVTFEDGDLAGVLASGRRYHVIVLAGVVEHLERPVDQLGALAALLSPGGLLCVQCPSFQNFRGDVYNTLGTLLGLPMSLTDLWQVTPAFMENAAPAMGVTLEKVAGGHYRFAFLERVLEDFRERLPNAARDATQGEGWHWDRFFAWLTSRVDENRHLIDRWVAARLLMPVPPSAPLAATRPAGMDDETWRPLEQYLTYAGWREPWYSVTPPVSHMGASAIYFFRRQGERG